VGLAGLAPVVLAPVVLAPVVLAPVVLARAVRRAPGPGVLTQLGRARREVGRPV